MSKLPYKILTISWDPTLAMDNPDFGDVQQRNIKYGQGVDAIFSITYSKKKQNLRDKRLSDNVFVYPTNSSSPLAFLVDAWRLADRICTDNKIDLVLTQDPFLTGLVGLWIKKRWGARLLIHYHGDFWHNNNWLREAWYNPILNVLQKFVLRGADALRVMSEGQKEKFLKTGWSEKRVRAISTPVDLKKYQGEKINNGKIVLHIGRSDEVKDYNTLIKAFKIVKEKVEDVSFRQFGGGKTLKEAINEHYKKLTSATGEMKSSDELIREYNNSSVVALSSTSESFGKVLVEANAAGKPVVSTATTGAKEIIQDGVNGFLVPVGDYEKLAEKIIWLLEHPIEAKEMGENGRKLVEKRYSDNTQKIIDFWDDIIKNNF